MSSAVSPIKDVMAPLLPEDGRKPRVQSAARAIAIVLAVSHTSNGLRAKEISETLRIPRQVTYHLIHTLSGTGIIRKNNQNRYVLGLAAGSIADGFRRQLAPPELLAPRVRAIVAATGETAYASGWMEDDIIVMASARGRSAVQAAEVPHGYSGNAHARASGKMLLALADPAKAEHFLAGLKLAPRTKNTITLPERLRAELQEVRARGYATDEEEFSEGLCCLAVPVEGLGGQFALAIAVPTGRFHANKERYLEVLREAAKMAV
ncbi:MAG: IclR family transcriptional regulator [Candidatus Korobacteraceae bacterium]